MTAPIHNIRAGSIAELMELEPGDWLLTINDHPINDILDYQFWSQDDYIVLEIEKQNKEIWTLEIEKEYDEDLGLEFADIIFDKIKLCQNRCLFCFVDQLPARMRPALYVKDDDYRHSFINGNFITLTNLTASDWQKIINMRLSPLYVSVHCTQGDLRRKMLKNPRAGNIREDLQRLRAAGIEVHTQIVLCPGWNDGPVLTDTINDLADLYPSVVSIGIVPVGLTAYRANLSPVAPVDAAMAVHTINMVNEFQDNFRRKWGKGLVYLADEFYLRAAREIPEADYYDDYCQLENGIGLSRVLLDEFVSLLDSLPDAVPPQEVYLLTGQSGRVMLDGIVERLNKIEGLTVRLLPVTNRYFGGGVNVTGLLTGYDVAAALGKGCQHKKVIVSAVMFREGQEVLLDDISLQDLKDRTGADIRIADGSAQDLVKVILAD